MLKNLRKGSKDCSVVLVPYLERRVRLRINPIYVKYYRESFLPVYVSIFAQYSYCTAYYSASWRVFITVKSQEIERPNQLIIL